MGTPYPLINPCILWRCQQGERPCGMTRDTRGQRNVGGRGAPELSENWTLGRGGEKEGSAEAWPEQEGSREAMSRVSYLCSSVPSFNPAEARGQRSAGEAVGRISLLRRSEEDGEQAGEGGPTKKPCTHPFRMTCMAVRALRGLQPVPLLLGDAFA